MLIGQLLLSARLLVTWPALGDAGALNTLNTSFAAIPAWVALEGIAQCLDPAHQWASRSEG
jgi:hypothetical protein